MLKVNNIEVVYNDIILALRGISLQVPEKSIIALLGGNGAGKSTTIKAIAGILPLEDGEIEGGMIEFYGKRIDRENPEEIVKKGISVIPEGRGIFRELTVGENIKVGAYTRKDPKEIQTSLQKVYEYFPILEERQSQLAGYLSGGEQQMLSIGRSLMSKPKLMMLDEPSLGLAPMIVREIFNILKTINAGENTAILLVEQNAKMALDFATYGYVLENGRIVMDAKSEVLIEDRDVKEFYLGLTDDKKKKNFANIKHYKRRKRWLS
ncbi:MAG: ABC transporter ATP-binding protein [Deltaproteobacteria bacterium RBG_19FT_COMBO_46_12]|jgi:branched-chain amino acid transport system ATP-binding protein|nr:MAG: ABC transporter ATP-binding protein [Deltaproteobacteria bacterium RBG_19FT_COMBO_46_12]